MVDAVISVVLEQLASFLTENVNMMAGVRNDVNSLTGTLGMLQAVIHDAEKRQITQEAVKFWLDQLKAIVYDAEDVLDEWNTGLLKKKKKQIINDDDDDAIGISNKVLSCFSIPCNPFESVSARYDIGTRIKEIRERVDEVADQSKIFMFTQSHEEQLPPRQQQTSSLVDVPEIFGRDHDKRDVLSSLLGETSSPQETNIRVLSIVGTGGFGKTTLAQLILKDDQVTNTFERRMWVCVSQPFQLFKVAKAIIEQAGENVPMVEEWDPLHKCLCESLKAKRLLLVLDDVWTKNYNDWEPLKLALDGAARGSRILITTRDEQVARMVSSSYIHNLRKLSEDNCWSLFEHIAFRERQQDLEDLKEIGKGIAEKCRGVPLAIKTLASQVHLLSSKSEWNDVLTSDIWEMQQEHETTTGFLPSLFMSYFPLRSDLKRCFTYCAIFPEDAIIEKDELVKLWMAQGFLGGSTDAEDIGERYFNELAMRSFFQDFRKDRKGRITSCKMHDLVHEFALFLTKGECVVTEKKNKNLLDGSKVYKAKNLRTLQVSSESTIPIKLVNEMRRLRVLNLDWAWVVKLPAEVKRLLHLRYLDLSRASLSELPETIGDLQNLQTLKLNHCRGLRRLPVGIGKLLNLRHLELIGTYQLKYIPRGIGRLRLLRTLSKLTVGAKNKRCCNLGALKHLNFLQGSLEIEGLEHVADENDAAEAELKKKKNLEKLKLAFGYGVEQEKDVEQTTKILEALQPHENLEELKIWNFGGSKLPQWMSSNSVLANLVELELERCDECAELPALGKLPSLEKLCIGHFPRLKRIGHEFYGFNEVDNDNLVVAFPKLKELTFDYMEDLVEWEFPVVDDDVNGRKYIIMPRLRDVGLSGCRKLRGILDLNKCKVLETIRITSMDELEELEEGEEVETGSITKGAGGDDVDFPCLRQVSIDRCLKLKRIPPYMFPCTLKELWIGNCPNLRGIQQPCLPPLLERLTLDGDVGILSESLPVNEEEEEESSQSQNSNNTNYPLLKRVEIFYSQHPSLPKGFNHLTAIQKLQFYNCESLDFELDELKHLTMLQDLKIRSCPILRQRSGEEGWNSKLSHVKID